MVCKIICSLDFLFFFIKEKERLTLLLLLAMTRYYYIENLIEFDVNEELVIDNNLTLKVAPKEEKAVLKQLLLKFGRVLFDFNLHDYRIKKRLSIGGANFEKREEEDLRYFVVEHKDSDDYDLNITRALLLMEKGFFVPFAFTNIPQSQFGLSIKYPFEELCAYTYFTDKNFELNFNKNRLKLKSFTENDRTEFLQIRSILNKFNNKKDNFIQISKALDDYFKINEISNNSVFKIICYIACFELLLVNSTIGKLRSISNQLQTKLNILNNKFANPIVISNHIKGPDTLNLGIVMSIIYKYRSSIAHGDFLDFNKKLKILDKISEYDILQFLHIVLRETVLLSIKEPELINGLRNS